MNHPLGFVPLNLRKPLLFASLALTVSLVAVFGVLHKPLRTAAAPDGIISFELASTPKKAQSMMDSWDERARLVASFGLGVDYLFMPAYSLALALGILLAAEKHSGWIKSLGAVAGWGAFGAALLDATENYALWHVLTGDAESAYPQIAAACATLKFALIAVGLLYTFIAWILPKRT